MFTDKSVLRSDLAKFIKIPACYYVDFNKMVIRFV